MGKLDVLERARSAAAVTNAVRESRTVPTEPSVDEVTGRTLTSGVKAART